MIDLIDLIDVINLVDLKGLIDAVGLIDMIGLVGMIDMVGMVGRKTGGKLTDYLFLFLSLLHRVTSLLNNPPYSLSSNSLHHLPDNGIKLIFHFPIRHRSNTKVQGDSQVRKALAEKPLTTDQRYHAKGAA